MSTMTHAGESQTTVPVMTYTLPLQPQRRKSRFLMGLLLGLLLALGGPYLWRREHPLDTAPVHHDHTMIMAPLHQVPQTVTLIYRNQNGALIRVPVNAEHYSEFVRIHTANFEKSRQQIRQHVEADFAQGMTQVFQVVQSRIPQLADWYFAYGTSYQLLWEAMASAVTNLGADNLKETVSADIERLIQKQYEYLVLKPELTDVEIQRLYQYTLEKAHKVYLQTLTMMEEDFQVFVAEHTSYLSDSPVVPELHLNWISQIHKLRIAPDASSSLGAFRGITLTTLGAITGKALGFQIGTVVAARLSLPVVERALLTVTGGTAGAGSGSLGGPIGATVGVVVGATVGIAVDWTLQQGIELLSRAQFESDIAETVDNTKKQFQEKLLTSLLKTVDAMMEDSIQLLLKF